MSASTYKTCAVILAAGNGSRMNMDKTKQTLSICGKSVLRRTLEAFEAAECVSGIAIVCKADELDFAANESKGLSKIKKVIIGGKTRAESARIGFLSICDSCDFVMIHDAARCLVLPEDINSVAYAAYIYGAATASVRVTDTVKECDSEGRIFRTVSRENLRSVQTPQAFEKELYLSAVEKNSMADSLITDDNTLIENAGGRVFAVDTSPSNIKITTSSDIELAKFIIRKRQDKI